jgi:hypothetical protein
VSKTVDRTPLFSKFKAHIRPDIPPPIIATSGSSETGVVNITCSCLNVFLITDLLEVPYDGFPRFLEVGLGAFMVALLLGLGLGWPVQVRMRVLGDKEGLGGFRVLKMVEEGKE